MEEWLALIKVALRDLHGGPGIKQLSSHQHNALDICESFQVHLQCPFQLSESHYIIL